MATTNLNRGMPMTNDMASKLTILLPAYNEGDVISSVLDEIKALPSGISVLVADSNSTDRTAEIAEAKGAVVIQGLKGKGNAVREALGHIETPYVFMIDSDYTYPAGDLWQLYHRMVATDMDVAMGYRHDIENGAMSPVNKFGNRCLSLLASILCLYGVKDVCTGMWGFKTAEVQTFNLISGGFTLEADLFINATLRSCKIIQMPIRYRKRPYGSCPKLKVRDGFKIGWFLIRQCLRRANKCMDSIV